MNSILHKIVAYKIQEVERRKRKISISKLERSLLFCRESISLYQSLKQKKSSGVIAEIKRKSPSQGVFHKQVDVPTLANEYAKAGASGISILTDRYFFGGNDQDLTSIRSLEVPLLRKDFIVDEYQIIEAKSIGADVILLIAALLDVSQLIQFTSLAHSLHLEVLLEVHDELEIEKSKAVEADLVGVNNRNLHTFEVSVETSKRLSTLLPMQAARVAESGIHSPQEIVELKKYGYDGFLIGQQFMQSENPSDAAHLFFQELKQQQHGV